MNSILKTALVATALLALSSTSALASNQNIITVQGQGEIKVAPDTAILSVGVQTNGETSEASQAANAQIMAAVTQALSAFNLDQNNVKTADYRVTPVTIYPPNADPKVTGYNTENSLQVKVTDLTQIGPILDAVGKAGANEIGNISYTSSRAAELKLQALKLAVQDARNEADAIAAAAGRKVRKPLHITTQNTNYAPVVAEAANARMASGMPSPQPTQINSDEVTVSATVTADFEY